MNHRQDDHRCVAGVRNSLTVAISLFLASVSSATAEDIQSVTVSGSLRVVDGDTLEIGLLQIRIHGIDAPEGGQFCSSPDGKDWPCGVVASNRIAGIIGTGRLDCDPLDRDTYGRLVARCLVGGEDIGAVMVTEGLAWAYTEFSDDYVEVEAEARLRGNNIWQAPTQTPKEYRDDVWARAEREAPGGKCPIRGNINGDQMIYHTPWSPNYWNVKINVERGERWFCSELEAQEAGWRQVRSR